jgi:lipoate-protein ligase A
VGKHQNIFEEVDMDFVLKHKINIARRISGGGTVFHDEGNVNFTFIKPGEKEKLVDFKKHTQPIIEILQEMGIDAKFQGKNDLRVGGKKISGNAEHVYKNKVLHHGTLLFKSDLSLLRGCLKNEDTGYESKAIKSVRSPVINIAELLHDQITVDDFTAKLVEGIKTQFPGSKMYMLNSHEIKEIKKLAREKYQSWEWIYGYSPKYKLKREKQIDGDFVTTELFVVDGMIEEIKIWINGTENIALQHLLKGTRHHPLFLMEKMKYMNTMYRENNKLILKLLY